MKTALYEYDTWIVGVILSDLYSTNDNFLIMTIAIFITVRGIYNNQIQEAVSPYVLSSTYPAHIINKYCSDKTS